MRDSVRLNSLENFLMNLPSISSKTWEMYSWAIPGSSMFCDLLFLVFSGVFLETAANFFLFFKVAMILREKFCQLWRLNWSFNSITKANISFYYEGNFQSKQTVNVFRKINTVPKATKLFNNIGTFVCPIYTFSLAGNITVYTPIQGTNRKKYFNYIIYKGKMPTLAWNKHLSVHFFLHRPHLFHLLAKKYGSNPSAMDIKVVIPSPT